MKERAYGASVFSVMNFFPYLMKCLHIDGIDQIVHDHAKDAILTSGSSDILQKRGRLQRCLCLLIVGIVRVGLQLLVIGELNEDLSAVQQNRYGCEVIRHGLGVFDAFEFQERLRSYTNSDAWSINRRVFLRLT